MTPLPGFKILLVGDSGTGKTHVTRTLIDAGIQPIALATENGFRALAPCLDPACEVCKANRNAPPIPYRYIPPAGSIDTLIEQAENVMTKTQQQLALMRDDKRKADYFQYAEVLKAVKEFKDDQGRNWGSITSWGTDRALVFDGLTATGTMAMDMFVGRRPLYDKPDYQIAQRNLLNFMVFLTHQVRTHVIVLAHVGRGEDSLEGRNKITVSTVGQKLAPELPSKFDDMIHADREGRTFKWTTIATGAVAKARSLPYGEYKPGYKQIVDSWIKAGGVIGKSEEPK